jgi:hypothetical protein
MDAPDARFHHRSTRTREPIVDQFAHHLPRRRNSYRCVLRFENQIRRPFGNFASARLSPQ